MRAPSFGSGQSEGSGGEATPALWEAHDSAVDCRAGSAKAIDRCQSLKTHAGDAAGREETQVQVIDPRPGNKCRFGNDAHVASLS